MRVLQIGRLLVDPSVAGFILKMNSDLDSDNFIS